MKSILVFILGVILSVALAEPLRYRQGQAVQASARQTDSGVAFQAKFGDQTTEANVSKDDERNVDPAPQFPPINQNGPYQPTGWRPLGQLLVLPFGIRENLESTTTVESSTFNDTENTEETSTAEAVANKGQQLEVETSEPKLKKTAPYKRPAVKLAGQLKLASKDESKLKSKNASKDSAESNETESTTQTENLDEATADEAKSGDLETTSEPESEVVDAEKSNESTNTQQTNQPGAVQLPQTAYFVQLPDGTLQQIVYVAPQQTPAAFVPQPAKVQFQQLNQSPNYPFALNPITNPRIVTFSSQYQAF